MDVRANMRRMLGVVLVIVLAGAAWWAWSERMSVRPGEGGARSPAPFVRLTGAGQAAADRVLQERAEFFDPTPLFLPTPRNAGQGGLPARLVAQPGQVFRDFPAKWSVADASLPIYGAEVVAAPEGLAEVMARANEAPFAGIGEVSVPVGRVASRAAFIEIKSMQGNNLITEAINGVALPKGDFAPLEFLATVSAFGLVGEPLLVGGSGLDEVDGFFRDYLVRTFRLGEKVAPGVYRVVVGP